MKKLDNSIANDKTWKDEVEASTFLKRGFQANELNIVGNNAIISEDSAFDISGVIHVVNTDETVLTNIPDNDHSVPDVYNRMTYHDGVWLIASSNSKVYKSTDGKSWTPTTVSGASTLYQIVWVGGTYNRWVLVGSGGKIYTSTNGTTWTARTSNNTGHFYGVAYSDTDDTLIAVCTAGAGGSRSTDGGITWSYVSGFTGQSNSKAIYWKGGIWVIVGISGEISTSYGNGTVWTSRTTTGTDILLDVVSGPYNNVFIAVGFNGIVHRSTNGGVNWTRIEMDTVETRDIYTAYYGDRFVIGSRGGGLWTSTDGLTWAEKSTNLPWDTDTEIIYGIAWDGDLYAWCSTRYSTCHAEGFIDKEIWIATDGTSFKSYNTDANIVWNSQKKGYYISGSNERVVAYYADDPDSPINFVDQQQGKES